MKNFAVTSEKVMTKQEDFEAPNFASCLDNISRVNGPNIAQITGFCLILHAGQALDYLAAAHRSLCYLSSDVK